MAQTRVESVERHIAKSPFERDGKPVKDFDRLTARIAQFKPGEEIDVVILRGDKELTKRVSLSDWASQPNM